MAKRNTRKKTAADADVERAAQLFRDFREEEPGNVTTVNVRLPRAAMVVGDVAWLGYHTSHGGKRKKYMHPFQASARPLLLASADGSQLIILGGKFTFTDRGIVDAPGRRR